MYGSNDHALNYETDDAVYFYSAPYEPINNFSAHTVEIWGNLFPTAEHAFQWKKFEETDPDHAEKVKLAGSPSLAKKIAHQNSNRRSDWDRVKVAFMRDIIQAKVAQHEDVREILLATGDKEIIENSPTDNFWGGGVDGLGENWVGKILTDVRDQLKT